MFNSERKNRSVIVFIVLVSFFLTACGPGTKNTIKVPEGTLVSLSIIPGGPGHTELVVFNEAGILVNPEKSERGDDVETGKSGGAEFKLSFREGSCYIYILQGTKMERFKLSDDPCPPGIVGSQ